MQQNNEPAQLNINQDAAHSAYVLALTFDDNFEDDDVSIIEVGT